MLRNGTLIKRREWISVLSFVSSSEVENQRLQQERFSTTLEVAKTLMSIQRDQFPIKKLFVCAFERAINVIHVAIMNF